MKHLLVLFSLIATFLAIPALSAAQPLVSWEVRGGLDLATQQVGDADLNSGYGFDGVINFWFMPFTSIYGGWGWHQFTSEGSFAGSNMDFNETGYLMGLEINYPIGDSEHGFYLRGGGTFKHLELESTTEDLNASSDHALGWHTEAGLAFLLGNDWVLKPGVRYQSLSDDIDVGPATTDFDLTYLNFSVGITRSF